MDKFNKGIRDKLKKNRVGAITYGKNVGKSFLSMAGYMVSSEMPTLTAYKEVNKDIATDMASVLSNPRKALGAKMDSAVNSGELGEIKKALSYALDDLKTGKFYDNSRDRTAAGLEIESMLNDFGGIDMSDYGSEDEDGGFSANESGDNDHDFQIDLAEAEGRMADRRTEATISAMGTSTEAIIANENANHNVDIKVRLKQHDQSMTGLNNIAMSTIAGHEMTAGILTEMVNMSKEANVQMLDKMDTMIGLLGEIRDLSTKTVAAVAQEQAPQILELPIKDGALDLKKYINMVKGNVDKRFNVSSNISMMTQGMSAKELIELYKSNPLGGMMTMMIRQMAPTGFFEELGNFDKSLKNFAPGILNKLANTKRADGSDSLLQLLGLKAPSPSTLSTEFNMGDMGYNGKADKAITEIIPLWLSKIHSALTGDDIRVYDYKAGKFVKAKDEIARLERQLGTNSALNNVNRQVDAQLRNINSSAVNTRGKQDKFKNDVKKYLNKLATDQGTLNIFDMDYESNKDAVSQLAYDVFGGVNSMEQMNLLMGMVRGMDRRSLIELSGASLIGQQNRDKNVISANKNLRERGLLSILSEGDDDLESFRSAVSNNVYLSDSDVNKSLGDKRKSMSDNISEILNVLNRGIITYSYGMGDATIGDGESFREIKTILNESQSKILKDLSDKITRDREAEDDRYRRENEAIEYGEDAVELSGASAAQISSVLRGRSSAEKQKKMSQTERDRNQFLSNFMSESSVSKLNNFRDMVGGPFNAVMRVMDMSEEVMFKFLYGDNYSEDLLSANSENGIFGTLTNMFTGLFTKAESVMMDVVKSKITDPIMDKLFNEEKGILTKFYNDRLRPLVDDKIGKGKDYLFGTFEETTDDEGNIIRTRTSDGLFGKATDKAKNYYDTKLKPKFREHGQAAKDQASGFISKMNMYFFGKDEDGEQSGKSVMGQIGDSLKSSFGKFKTWLFGERGEDGEKTNDEKLFDSITGEVKKAAPDMIVKGAIGAGATVGVGMLTGMFLPGGPIMGALLGSLTGLITGSEKVKEFVFGENGLDEDLVDGFKKFAPKMGIGALIGGALGTFGLLPFGLGSAAGAAIGAIGGMTAASDQLKEVFFGNAEDENSGLFSKKGREKFFSTVLPSGLVTGAGTMFLSTMLSSGIGILPALPFIPGGPIVGLLGGLIGAFNADSIKNFFFGDGEDTTDENGNVIKGKEGVFTKVFNTTKESLFQPMIDGLNNTGKSIGAWFQRDIVDQLKEAMQPFKDEVAKAKDSIGAAFRNIGDSIGSALGNIFGESLGKPLDEFMKENVFEPLKRKTSMIMGIIGKVVGGVISAPFKLFNSMFTSKGEFDPAGIEARRALGDEKRNERAEARRLKREERAEQRRLGRMTPEERADKRSDDQISAIGKLKLAIDGIKFALIGINSSDAEAAQDNVELSQANTAAAREAVMRKREAKEKRKQERKTKSEDKLKSRLEARSNKIRRDKERKKERTEKLQARQKEREAERDARRNDGKNDRPGISPNSDLSIIARNTKKISEFLVKHLSGMGYDLRYVRNLLARQYGELEDGELPDEASAKNTDGYRRRGNIFTRARDKVSDGLFGAKLWAMDKIDGAKSAVSGALGAIAGPYRFVRDMMSNIGTAIKENMTFLKDAAMGFLDTMGHALKTTADSFITVMGDTLKTASGIISGAAKGVGEALGGIAKELGGLIGEMVGVARGVIGGLSEFSQTVFPEMMRGLGKGLVGAAKLGWKAISGTVKAGVGAVKGAYGFAKRGIGKVFGRNSSNDPAIRRSMNVQDVYVIGGNLDGAGDILGGLKVAIKNFTTKMQPQYALPVYLAGSYEESIQRTRQKVKAYRVANAKIKNNSSASGDIYDTMMENSTSAVSMEALESVHRFNDVRSPESGGIAAGSSNRGSGSGGSGDDDDISWADLLGLNLASNLLGKVSKGAKGLVKGGLGLLGKALPTLAAGGLLALGTKNAYEDGNYGQVAENVTRAAGGVIGGSLTSGRLGIGLLNQSANGASKGAAGVLRKGLASGGVSGALTNTFFRESGEEIVAKTSKEILKDTTGALATRAASTTAGKAVVGAVSNIADNSTVTKVINAIKTAVTKFFDLSVIKNHLGPAVKTLSKKVTESLGKRITGSIIGKLGKQILRFLGGPATIAVFAVADFTTGMAQSDNIFRVRAGTSDIKMRLAAGIGKAISGLTFGLISEDWLADLVYPLIAEDEDEAKLAQEQSELSALATEQGMTAEEYSDNVENQSWLTKLKNVFGFNTDKDGDDTTASDMSQAAIDAYNNGARSPYGYGKGKGPYFRQNDPKWNRNSGLDIENSGCGPTVAAMMVGNGRGPNPEEATKVSMVTGNKDIDGGTNPKFFETYGKLHGQDMHQGDVDAQRIASTLTSGGKVALMGKDRTGGVYGKNMHYVMGDGIDSKGNVNIVDPLGKTSKKRLGDVVKGASTAIYKNGYGRGDEEAATTSTADTGLSGIMGAISSAIGAAIGLRFGFSTGDTSTTGTSTSTGSIAGTAAMAGANIGAIASAGQSSGSTGLTAVTTDDAVIQKTFELITASEGAYTTVINDSSSGSGQGVGPSVGIFQWHAGNIVWVMSGMAAELPNDQEAQKWAAYDWSANVPFSEAQLSELRAYLTKNETVAKKVQDKLGIEHATTLVNKVKNAGITDPKATVLLAQMLNTGNPGTPSVTSVVSGIASTINTLDTMYNFMINKSWWVTKADSKFVNGYKNRINHVYEELKAWVLPEPPMVMDSAVAGANIGLSATKAKSAGHITDVRDWFVKTAGSNTAVSQQFHSGHDGLDVGGVTAGKALGSPIYSPVNGVVNRSNVQGSVGDPANGVKGTGFGNRIEVIDSNGHAHMFAHMRELSPFKKSGDKVAQGDILGYIGNTGSSTGPHLHYEVNPVGSTTGVDPVTYISNHTQGAEYSSGEFGKGGVDTDGYTDNKALDEVKSSKAAAKNISVYQDAIAMNDKIKGAKDTQKKNSEYEKLEKKIEKLSENGKGAISSTDKIVELFGEMLTVLKTIATNTANTQTVQQNTNNTYNQQNVQTKTPITKPIGQTPKISTGAYTIDALTAR